MSNEMIVFALLALGWLLNLLFLKCFWDFAKDKFKTAAHDSQQIKTAQRAAKKREWAMLEALSLILGKDGQSWRPNFTREEEEDGD